MNLDEIFLFNFTTISAYFTPVDIDIIPENFLRFASECVNAIGQFSKTVSSNTLCPIHFTELQTILLTIFLVIFSINLALIAFYWQKYGGVITDRFIRPSIQHFYNNYISIFIIKRTFTHFINILEYHHAHTSRIFKIQCQLLIYFRIPFVLVAH